MELRYKKLPAESEWWTVLEFAFQTKALRDICESEEKAKEKLGSKAATVLARRLSDFQSVETINDLPVVLLQKGPTTRVFKLPDNWQMTVTGGHGKNPKTNSGAIDWSKVTRLKILKIEKCQ